MGKGMQEPREAVGVRVRDVLIRGQRERERDGRERMEGERLPVHEWMGFDSMKATHTQRH